MFFCFLRGGGVICEMTGKVEFFFYLLETVLGRIHSFEKGLANMQCHSKIFFCYWILYTTFYDVNARRAQHCLHRVSNMITEHSSTYINIVWPLYSGLS